MYTLEYNMFYFMTIHLIILGEKYENIKKFEPENLCNIIKNIIILKRSSTTLLYTTFSFINLFI